MGITQREKQLLLCGILLLKADNKKEIRQLIEDGISSDSEENDVYNTRLKTIGELEMLWSKINKIEVEEGKYGRF